MIIGIVAPSKKHVNVTMSDGNNHSGHFVTHSYPFAKFQRDEGGKIYLHLDHITAVYLLED